jgi:RNA polymerase sigma-70 factor (ECF subfamily)
MLNDDDSVRAAYDAHGAELYRFCHGMLGDAGQAEDAVQETFVRAWRSRDRFDPAKASLRTWLFVIARNVAIDLHRRRAIRPAVVGKSVAVTGTVSDHADRVVVGMQLQQGLACLSPEQRFVVREIAVGGRSSVDVAQELGTSDGTVRSRLFYGLKAMRVAIEKREWSGA